MFQISPDSLGTLRMTDRLRISSPIEHRVHVNKQRLWKFPIARPPHMHAALDAVPSKPFLSAQASVNYLIGDVRPAGHISFPLSGSVNSFRFFIHVGIQTKPYGSMTIIKFHTSFRSQRRRFRGKLSYRVGTHCTFFSRMPILPNSVSEGQYSFIATRMALSKISLKISRDCSHQIQTAY
jgi:hypothetical protein